MPETRGGIMERMIREFKLGGEGWKEETELVRGARFTNSLILMRLSR